MVLTGTWFVVLLNERDRSDFRSCGQVKLANPTVACGDPRGVCTFTCICGFRRTSTHKLSHHRKLRVKTTITTSASSHLHFTVRTELELHRDCWSNEHLASGHLSLVTGGYDQMTFATMAQYGEKLSTVERAEKHLQRVREEDGAEGLPSLNEIWKAASPNGKGSTALLNKYIVNNTSNLHMVSWESVQHRAPGLARSIHKNSQLLGDILERHEAMIHRRRLRKSSKLRRMIILEAWGSSMSLSHRPDFEPLEHEDDYKRHRGTDFRDAYLWPYINEEDLCSPRSLLLLTSTRSRCHPGELAGREHDAHRLGHCAVVFGFDIGKDFENHCMDLTSVDT
jgi:hypothetical protein